MLGADKVRRNIVLPRELSKAITKRARVELRSASNLITVVMTAYLEAKEKPSREQRRIGQ